jgi:hypothetical protein
VEAASVVGQVGVEVKLPCQREHGAPSHGASQIVRLPRIARQLRANQGSLNRRAHARTLACMRVHRARYPACRPIAGCITSVPSNAGARTPVTPRPRRPAGVQPSSTSRDCRLRRLTPSAGCVRGVPPSGGSRPPSVNSVRSNAGAQTPITPRPRRPSCDQPSSTSRDCRLRRLSPSAGGVRGVPPSGVSRPSKHNVQRMRARRREDKPTRSSCVRRAHARAPGADYYICES